MKWTSVNLPWLEPNPPEREEIHKIWTNLAELIAKRKEAELPAPPPTTNISNEALMSAEEEYPDLSNYGSYDDAWLERMLTKVGHDPVVVSLVRHRHRRQFESRWEEQQPESVEARALTSALQKQMDTRSFRNHPHCKPGTLIEFQADNGKHNTPSRYLIGNINHHGGCCDCCGAMNEMFVMRYTILDLEID